MAGGGSMPYVLAENPVFTLLESVTTRAVRLAGLNRLVAGTPMWNSPGIANLVPGPGTTVADDRWHLQNHWFGYRENGPTPPAMPPPSNLGTTGWWRQWRGNAHEVVRQTLQRAYQASLDIKGSNGLVPPSAGELEAGFVDTGTTCLPIRIVWMCGAPLLHGFVLTDAAHVTVVIATPPPDGAFTSAPPNGLSPVIDFPKMLDAVAGGASNFQLVERGAWVVGHAKTGLFWFPRPLHLGDPHPMPAPDLEPWLRPDFTAGNRLRPPQPVGCPPAPYPIRGSFGPVITRPL